MGIIGTFLNPINWVKAYRFHKRNAKYDKSDYDLELYLYSRILKNDMLHYGYFEDAGIQPETISLKQFEDAQVKYSENIIDLIPDKDGLILDVGCGMGGFSALLLERNYKVEALTPNKNQKEHIDRKYPRLICHNKKFEDFTADKKFGTVINSESLQYINLDEAFKKAYEILSPGGRWIIVDYFRIGENSANKSGHKLEGFLSKIEEYNWKVISQRDITQNVLPTLKFVNMYATRFLLPLKHFAFEKLRYKKAWLYYLTGDIRESITKKIDKEAAAIDPEKFIRDKQYIIFVLEKNSGS